MACEIWGPILQTALEIDQATEASTQERLYSEIRGEVDIDSYIDYLLVNFFCGNTDWPDKNFVAARRSNNSLLRFYCWDSEWTVGLRSPVDVDVVSTAKSGIAELFYHLKGYRPFARQFSDRVHRHFVRPDGVFFVEQESAVNVPATLYLNLSREIEVAIGAELARWEDQDGIEFRRDDWLCERRRLMRTYFPRRRKVVMNALSLAGLYHPAHETSDD